MFHVCEDQCCRAVTDPPPLRLSLIDCGPLVAAVCSHRKDPDRGWLATLLEPFFCFNRHFGSIRPRRTKAAFVVCACAMMNMNMIESSLSLVAVMVVGFRCGWNEISPFGTIKAHFDDETKLYVRFYKASNESLEGLSVGNTCGVIYEQKCPYGYGANPSSEAGKVEEVTLTPSVEVDSIFGVVEGIVQEQWKMCRKGLVPADTLASH